MILKSNPQKKIAVIDSLSTGPEIVLVVEKICDLIKQNFEFDDVVKYAKDYLKESKILFALSSFDNLVNAGRMSKISGKLAKLLGIWGVGEGSEDGKIKVIKKIKGQNRVINCLIDNISTRVECPEKVVISHCHNLSFSEKLKNKIRNIWNKVVVKINKTRGLCSYYAERGGIIVGFWGKKRI